MATFLVAQKVTRKNGVSAGKIRNFTAFFTSTGYFIVEPF